MLNVNCARTPDREPPRLRPRGQDSHYGLDVEPADIVDVWDYRLAGREFLLEGHPQCWPNFGPGTLAAFCGCDLLCDDHTTWFLPRRLMPARDWHPAMDMENRWLRHICTLTRVAAERWQGQVMIGMTDMGGASDVVASFLTSDRMLTELYDDPTEVERLMWTTHTLWWQAYREIDKSFRAANPGYSYWTTIFSEKPYVMLQSDFCYMIGPEMFDRFIRPELVASCRQLPHAFYHLDGIGELPHLDSLLAIPELQGIQWVQGAGQPGPMHWLDVYRRILRAGKHLQVTGPVDEKLEALERLAGEGYNIGLAYIDGGLDNPAQHRRLNDFLKRYGLQV